MPAITETILSQQSQDLFFTVKADGDPNAELVVRSFKVNEGLSKLFTVDLELASRRSDIDLTKLIDRPACLTINDRYGKPRFFHGLVEMAQKGATGRPNDSGLTWTFYRLTLMPAAHRLRHSADMRIFMQKSVPEIVETILQENGVLNYKFTTTKEHVLRAYCTQYKESMWSFVERLLSEEGYYYTFIHEQGKHTLAMSDRSQIAPDCPITATAEYNANSGGDVKGPWVRDFAWTEVVRSSQVVLNDYTFRNPAASLLTNGYANDDNGLVSKLEMYDFPGRYKDYNVGQNFAQYEIDALRRDASLGTGKGHCPQFTAGAMFTLQEHNDKSYNRKYLLVDVTHEGTQPQALEEAAGDGGGTFYDTVFTVVRDNQPWRPCRKKKPVVDGPEAAVVSGPAGEQIYTNEHSQIRVSFPWDRRSKKDDTSSCWIRVAQAWGGGTYGNVAIPRIGHEVIISFLSGDPDQPYCSGRTYHATNKTPYQLPGHKTKMAIRSDTHKGSGYNEISFEDENSQQNFFMHAEKDHTLKVKNNQIARIDANATQAIGQSQSLEVGQNVSHQVGGGMNMVIGAVGSAAAGLVSQGLSGLMGQSAGLLQQGMNIAMQAMQAAASGGSGGSGAGKAAEAVAGAVLGQAGAGAVGQAAASALGGLVGNALGQSGGGSSGAVSSATAPSDGAAPPAISGLDASRAAPLMAGAEKVLSKGIPFANTESPTPQGGDSGSDAPQSHTAPSDPSALMKEAAGFASSLAGGELGALAKMAVGGLDAARQGINSASPYSLSSDGGSGMASAGSQLAQQIGSMIGGGILNQLVSKFTSQTTGIAVSETIGNVKVSTVGHVSMESVGHTKKISAGEEFQIAVGPPTDKDGKAIPPKARFVMKGDGTIVLMGVKILVEAAGPIQHRAKVIHEN